MRKGSQKNTDLQHSTSRQAVCLYLKKVQNPDSAILVSEDGAPAPIPSPALAPAPAPAPVPSPDFPFQEFPLTEVATQSQIDYPSISDARESSNSSRKATKSTDLPLKSGLDSSSHEEMRDSAASDQHIQSSRDPSTISTPENSNTRKSIPGIIADAPDTTPDTTPMIRCTVEQKQVCNAY